MSVHLIRNPVVVNRISWIWDRRNSAEQCSTILYEAAMFLFYEVVEYLQSQPHDDKAAQADKTEVRSVVTPLFPDSIEFADVHDESFEESQLAVVTPLRGRVSLGDPFIFCLPKAGYVRADKFFNRDRKDLPPLDFHGKIGVVADTLIDKDTSAFVQGFKSKGAAKVIIASVFTSPEELEKIHAAHPDVEIFTASIADARGLIGSI